ncbi:MAG: superoxide dismutase [Pseudomonadota bacterium]
MTRHSLPKLPYSDDALAPFVSANTLGCHYGKHHKAYIDRMNELIEGTPLADQPLEHIVREASMKEDRKPLFNAAAQAWNHAFYWQSMKPNGGGEPSGKLKDQISSSFGDVKKFLEEFSSKSVSLFGSGWVWLVSDAGKLKVVPTKDADTPIAHGQTPLITIDVWEHAYYLDYQNRRKDYVAAFLDHLVNWEFAEENLAKN